MSKGRVAATAHSRPKDGWLIMLFMAGDNNLTEDMVLALQELTKVGPPYGGDVIVAQLDPQGDGLATARYDLTKRNSAGSSLDDHRVVTLVDQSSGSVTTLFEFVCWAVNKYDKAREKSYLLVLSGHGSGVTDDFFLRDDASQDSLTIPELVDAIRAVNEFIDKKGKKKIDILGLDACFMAMGEVAHELRDSASILIGAEGFEPEFGWPYRTILTAAYEAVKANGGKPLSPDQLARLIVDKYLGTYADYDRTAGRSVDLSAIRLKGMARLSGPFR